MFHPVNPFLFFFSFFFWIILAPNIEKGKKRRKKKKRLEQLARKWGHWFGIIDVQKKERKWQNISFKPNIVSEWAKGIPENTPWWENPIHLILTPQKCPKHLYSPLPHFSTSLQLPSPLYIIILILSAVCFFCSFFWLIRLFSFWPIPLPHLQRIWCSFLTLTPPTSFFFFF